MTDGVSVTYLCDLVIVEELRGRGLGAWLLKTMLKQPQIKRTAVVLLTREATGFYKKLGFEERTAMVWRKK